MASIQPSCNLDYIHAHSDLYSPLGPVSFEVILANPRMLGRYNGPGLTIQKPPVLLRRQQITLVCLGIWPGSFPPFQTLSSLPAPKG